MPDGVALAATLYLPYASEPQPCLLEALPYRKDDLTASYAASYERFETSTATRSAGSTCAAPARRAVTRPTSTRRTSSAT